jgi:benzoylformate decarboxylase
VWTNTPVRPQDVPGAIERAYHEATALRGPALVVVPVGDWLEPTDPLAGGSPLQVVRPLTVGAVEVAELAELIAGARRPALVVGPGADSREGWNAVVALAERLRCPVWQETFSRRAGFPQDHPQFSGHMPWRRRLIHETLAPHDLVLAIGTNAFRTYQFDEPAPLVGPQTRVAVISDDPAEAHRSPSELALVAPVAPACEALVARVAARDVAMPEPLRRPAAPQPPAPGEPLTPAHVFDALARRLSAEAVLVEETPSSQPELYRRIPIRAPLGFVGTANGGLGFGLSGSIGLRLGLPERPVVGVIGDGSTMYAIQALWSAAHYRVGVLLIVMANGGYAVMDALAREAGGDGPWPKFGPVDIAGIARCLGCPSVRVATHSELLETFDDVLPGLAARDEPLLVEIAVSG